MSSIKIDNSKHSEIAVAFCNEMNKKYGGIKPSIRAFLKEVPEDAVYFLNTNVEKMIIPESEAGAFVSGFLVGYKYCQYRIEALNALNRDNLQK